MPHIIVKLVSGKSEYQKERLAEAIVKNAVEIFGIEEATLSVAIEEVSSEDWMEKVYQADIQKNWSKLLKKPGYGPLNN